MDVRTIATPTHGRYLIHQPSGGGPWPLLVGFHGYKENARIDVERLLALPGADGWLVVSVQGLHRFYTRGGDVVASWMTKEDRELAIADNVRYVGSVLESVRAEFATREPTVFAGFSQGVAMAFRAAAHYPANGLIVLGADVPPDVAAGTGVTLPPVLYGHGTRDEFYTAAHHEKDIATLERFGATVDSVDFDGGHDWAAPFSEAAGRFLATVLTGSSSVLRAR